MTRAIGRMRERAGALTGDSKKLLGDLVKDMEALTEPLRRTDACKHIGTDHVQMEPLERPVALLEDLNKVLTVTNTMQVSDLQIQQPDPLVGGSAPSVQDTRKALAAQRLFLDACQAAKQDLETKITLLQDTRSKISAELLSPSPLLEKTKGQLVALSRAVEKCCRHRSAGEKELSQGLGNFESVQSEKLKLLEEQRVLLGQQVEDIERMMSLKRQSLYKDLLDRVKVQAAQSKRHKEQDTLETITKNVCAAVGGKVSVSRDRRDGVTAAHAVAKRQGEFLDAMYKFITTHIGTAMEQLHRLAISAHQQCLEISLREWQGLELFYSQWDNLYRRAREEKKLLDASGNVSESARAVGSIQVAREQMEGIGVDFRQVPEWVWRLRSFQALADNDPVRFADVRSVLCRGRSDDGDPSDVGEDDAMVATEVWLAHIGALSKGLRTPRVEHT